MADVQQSKYEFYCVDSIWSVFGVAKEEFQLYIRPTWNPNNE